MRINQSTDDGVTVLNLEGRLDSTTSGDLQTAVLSAVEAGAPRLVMDFTKVDYVSSAGLRVVLLAAKRTKGAGGTLAIFGLNNPVREVFEISGFVSIIAIADTAAEALRAVKA